MSTDETAADPTTEPAGPVARIIHAVSLALEEAVRNSEQRAAARLIQAINSDPELRDRLRAALGIE
jgi:hypothetical protein